MQWETKGQFSGQVKPVGIEKSMGWKLGFVHFDYDTASGAWMVRLYFKVNPHKVCQQMKIGQSDNLDVKCGRLMIENKKGDGIHIKLSSTDVAHAKLLVSKIKNSMSPAVTSNKAEVGLPSNTKLLSHMGAENVRPDSAEDSLDLSLFQASGDMSPEQQSVRWPPKNTPPTQGQEHSAAPKRKLELFSPERLDDRGRDKDLSSSQRFTGMKDYSKRNLHGGNSMSVSNALGPRSFYGIQKTNATNSVHRSSQISSSFHQSPALKRPKLSSFSMTVDISRMSHPRDGQPNTPAEASSTSPSRGNSLYVPDPPRHRIREGETVGFQNLGNTCFLNATLQCLSALEPLSLDIHSAVAEYGKELKPKSITRKLYLLMKDVRRYDVCPERIKELLVKLRGDMNVKFAPNTQQDAHEVLTELLNRVDDEVKVAMRRHASSRLPASTPAAAAAGTDVPGAHRLVSPLGKSRIEEPTAASLQSLMPTPTESNFCWSYRKHIYFHECKTEVVSSQTEREMTLMLALDSSTKNLQDCIHKYFESNDVEMKCEKCGKEEKATITRKIVRRPRVFILNLLRYHSDREEATKKADHVGVPSYISICKYCADDVMKPAHIDPVFLLDRRESLDAMSAVTDDLDHVADVNDLEQMVPGSGPAGAPNISSVKIISSSFLNTLGQLKDTFGCPVDSARTLSLKAYHLNNSSLGKSLETGHLLRTPPIHIHSAFMAVLNSSERDKLMNSKSGRPVAVVGRYRGNHPDMSEISELVSGLADLVSCHLRSVDTYLEDSHERGDDVSGLYSDAHKVILSLDKNMTTALQCQRLSPEVQEDDSFGSKEILLSEILLKKALMLDERQLDSLPEDCLQLAIEDLLVTRYNGTASNQKSMYCLMDDLGLCVAALEAGIMTSSSQERVAAADRFNVIFQKYVMNKSSLTCTERGSPDGGSDLDVENDTGDGSYVKVEDDIYFKRTGPVEVQAMDDSSVVRSNQGSDVLPPIDIKFVDALSVDVWNYTWDEDVDKEGRQPVSDISLQASYPMSPDSSGHMLQGQHISSFTESDLQNIDCASLTEDEMMVYAQALSRFTYQKELAPVVGHSAAAVHCDSSPDGAETVHQNSPCDQDCSLKEPSCSDGAESEAQLPESSSGRSPTECDTSQMWTPTSAGHMSVDSESLHKSDMEADEECSMLCHETFRNSEESQGNPYNSDCKRLSQISTAQSQVDTADQPLMGSDIHDVSVTHCVSCGNVCLTVCTVCGALDQTDFNSQPLDASFCTLAAETVPSMSRETLDSSVVLYEKASDHHSLGQHCVDVNTSTDADSSMHSTAGRLVTADSSMHSTAGRLVTADSSMHSTAGRLVTADSSMHSTSVTAAAGDHGRQGNVGGLQEFLFSPPKTNHLIKTRDYARLKSPALSPKKRTAKGPSPKSDCVSKRLHYSEKGSQLQQCGADRVESLSVASHTPDLHTSMEVNIDDMSFFGNTNISVDAAAWNLSHQSTPPSTSSTPSGRCDDPGQTPVDCDKPNSTSASIPVLEGSNASQISRLSDLQIEAVDSSAPTPSSRKVATSESLQENIPPQASVTPKRKLVRSSATYVPDIEEKENVHQHRSTGGLLQIMEDGRQNLSYRLVSVVDHTGTSQFTGHYTAYAFNMSRQKWFHLNDTDTRTVTEDLVHEDNAQTGYLFFYMDKDLFDEYNKSRPAADR